MKFIRDWWENKKIVWAFRVVESHGLSVVKIVKRGKDHYFVATDGSLRKIK